MFKRWWKRITSNHKTTYNKYAHDYIESDSVVQVYIYTANLDQLRYRLSCPLSEFNAYKVEELRELIDVTKGKEVIFIFPFSFISKKRHKARFAAYLRSHTRTQAVIDFMKEIKDCQVSPYTAYTKAERDRIDPKLQEVKQLADC